MCLGGKRYLEHLFLDAAIVLAIQTVIRPYMYESGKAERTRHTIPMPY